MKLIKLEINNFRQFYGKQTINFSVEPKRGVTLIHGENNGGKTALLNALRWCLYEDTTENLLDPTNLLNKHADRKGEKTFSVFLQVEHENKLFEIRRTQTKNISENTLKIFEIEDGCYKDKVENPNTLINILLPKEMSQYFFYQGEGTGTLNSQNNFSHIKNAMEKVLGLTIANKTLQHLNSVKNSYLKDLKQYDASNEVDKLVALKETFTTSLEREKEFLKEKITALNNAHEEYESQIKKLERFDKTTIEDKIKLRSKMQSDLLYAENKQRSLFEEKRKKTLAWALISFSRRLSTINTSEINTAELNKSLRYTVDSQLLKEIFFNNECICGTHIQNNTQAAYLLEELSKHAVDPELKRRWSMATKLHNRLKDSEQPYQAMKEILSDIDNYEDRIQELARNIKDLNHTIIESDVDDIKTIETDKNAAKSKLDHLNQQIPRHEQKIKELEINIKDNDLKIDKILSVQPKATKLKKLLLATDEIIKLYQETINTSMEGVSDALLTKMQTLFSKVAFNGYTVKKAKNAKSEDFTWVIVDKDNHRVAAGNGYQAMLSISFIVALIQFSKARATSQRHLLTPGTIAPFIADSILAFIGPDNGRELVRYIADQVDQSIFMFSQAQWTENHTDVGIRHKIGKEYNLVQHTVLSEEEFKGQYPTKLTVQGHHYDVVRFGSEFDKVTIEEISSHG